MKQLITILFLLVFSMGQAQTSLWNTPVDKNTTYKQLENGNIFIKKENSIKLVDNKTGETLWSNNIEMDNFPTYFDDLPILYNEGKNYAIINAETGDIIDKSATNTTVMNTYYFWEEGRVIVETNQDNKIVVVNLDLNDLSKSWHTEIGEVKKSFFGLSVSGLENRPQILADGTLVFTDKKFVAMLDSAGKMKSKVEYKDDINPVAFNEYKELLYIIEDEEIVHVLDTKTGKETAETKLDDKKFIANIINEGEVITFIRGKSLKVLNAITLEEIVEHKLDDKVNATYIDPETNAFYILAKKSIYEINQSTGEVIRQKEFDENLEQIKVIGDRVFVGKNRSFNQIDLATFKPKYPEFAKIIDMHDYMDLGRNTLFINKAATYSSITMIDPKGEDVWSKNYEGGTTFTIDKIGKGLLVVAAQKIDFLSESDGKSLWKDDISLAPSSTYTLDRKANELVIYAEQRIHFINMENGKVRHSEDKFKFKDFDEETQQPQLLSSNDRIFLKGSNTVHITDRNGKEIFSDNFKKSDNKSTLMNLAQVAVVAGAVATGNAGSVLTVHSGGEMVHKGGLVDGLNQTGAYADDMKERRRRMQNKGSNAYPFVYTRNDDKDKVLRFIDIKDGTTKYDVEMEDDNYIMDDIDGVLFHIKDRKLEAVSIK